MEHSNEPSAELRARVALQKHRFHNAHSLGQNFLLSEERIASLLDLAAIDPQDQVLEIGPGAGVMTRLLAERCGRVLAVELDKGLQPVLDDVLRGLENVRVIYDDILKADIAELITQAFEGDAYRVVANLPYYITADILLKLTSLPVPPRSICIMVQKEAAERIMSEPGAKSWCAMAAEVRFYGQSRVLMEMGPEAFDPPPHVTSCFLCIDRHPVPVVEPTDARVFQRVIRAAFAMRRKTLYNNLKAAFGLDSQTTRSVLDAAGLDDRIRGEALTLRQLCLLSDVLSSWTDPRRPAPDEALKDEPEIAAQTEHESERTEEIEI